MGEKFDLVLILSFSNAGPSLLGKIYPKPKMSFFSGIIQIISSRYTALAALRKSKYIHVYHSYSDNFSPDFFSLRQFFTRHFLTDTFSIDNFSLDSFSLRQFLTRRFLTKTTSHQDTFPPRYFLIRQFLTNTPSHPTISHQTFLFKPDIFAP